MKSPARNGLDKALIVALIVVVLWVASLFVDNQSGYAGVAFVVLFPFAAIAILALAVPLAIKKTVGDRRSAATDSKRQAVTSKSSSLRPRLGRLSVPFLIN